MLEEEEEEECNSFTEVSFPHLSNTKVCATNSDI